MPSDESKRWFLRRVAEDPDFLERHYFPELEKSVNRAEAALREAIRKQPIEAIKYQMGWLDGAQRICAVIDGLRISEERPKSEPGLMARIFSGARDDQP